MLLFTVTKDELAYQANVDEELLLGVQTNDGSEYYPIRGRRVFTESRWDHLHGMLH